MKKLLSLILCVALLMGICASALAEKNRKALMKENNTLKDNVLEMKKNFNESILCMLGFEVLMDDEFDKEYDPFFADENKNVREIISALMNVMTDVMGITQKDDIQREDYEKAVSIFQRGVDLLPSIRKYDKGSKEYKEYSATLSERNRNLLREVCSYGVIWIIPAVQHLEVVKKMIADGQKQPLDLITNIPKLR